MIKQQTKKQPQSKTTQNSRSNKPANPELTFLEHIFELRNRLFWIVAVLIITSSIGFHFKDFLVDFIVAPLHGEKLIYLTPGGGFSFIFTVCLYFGALLTIPVIIYHLYRFLQPVLAKTSRRFIVGIVLLSALLAAAGAVFGYMVAIPAAISFLTTFAGDAVAPSLTAESYLGFVVMYLLGLAALFQLPLLLFIFDHVRPFPPGALLSSQRFVIVGSVVAAALITPTPDVVNQMIVAGPIIVVYQLGAIAVYIRRKSASRKRSKMTQSAYIAKERTAIQQIQKSIPQHAAVLPSPAYPATRASGMVQSSAAMKPVARSVDGMRRPVPRQQVAVPPRHSSAAVVQRARHANVPAPRIDTRQSKQGMSIDGLTVA